MSKEMVQNWCSDELHSILGCSDSVLAVYLTSEAVKASSYIQILSILKEGNVKPIHAATESEESMVLEKFARDLFFRCHKDISRPTQQKKKVVKRKTNADWIESAAKYDLLEDTKDNKIEIEISLKKQKSHKSKFSAANAGATTTRKEEKRGLYRRHHTNSSSSEGEDDGRDNVRERYEDHVEERRHNREQVERKRKTISSLRNEDDDGAKNVSDEEDGLLSDSLKKDRERENDIKERDEFAKRLLIKQDQKNLKSAKNQNGEENRHNEKLIEMEHRLAKGEIVEDEAGNRITLQNLRDESRRSYLKKRTKREIELLERELADEEEMFDLEQLTEAEKKRLELRRGVLKLARGDGDKVETTEGFYQLPDEYEEREGKTKAEKDRAVLKSRYVEEKYVKTEQQAWEEEQTKKASIGSIKGRNNKDEKYDLVFADQIDFVMADKKKGYDNRKKGKRREEHSRNSEKVTSVSSLVLADQSPENLLLPDITKHEKMLRGRKKLPVFPYREEFLAAVKDQQVLILVGETGSGKT